MHNSTLQQEGGDCGHDLSPGPFAEWLPKLYISHMMPLLKKLSECSEQLKPIFKITLLYKEIKLSFLLQVQPQ